MITSNLYEKIPAERNNFPIRLLRRNNDDPTLPHWHENIELLYFTSTEPKTTVQCGKNIFEVCPDTLIIVNSNEIHSVSDDKKAEYWCILLNPSFFRDIDYPETVYMRRVDKDSEIKKYFEDIFSEYSSALPGFDMAIKGKVYNLMAYLFRNYQSTEKTESENIDRQSGRRRINDILQYAEYHYDEKLTASVLAKRYFLSEYYFCHLFKSETGMSFTEYLNRLRVQKARVLIENSPESITEISGMVGIEDVNYFCRIFKKYSGVTPTELRK